MEKMKYPTMNALSYARIQSINTGYNFCGYKNFGYESTDILIPMATECPCCNKVMASDLTPIIAVNNLLPADSSSEDEKELINIECKVVSIYRCTACNSLFSIWSKHKSNNPDYDDTEWSCEILKIFPFSSNTTNFSEEICNLSNMFVLIYNQAEIAEKSGLNEICGMGFRKALEHLVDAYIRKYHHNENIAFNLPLSKKINDYIGDTKIKTLAKKTAWIGNDATHIDKRHPERDIQDMKKFIRAMTTMIDAEFAYEDADTIERD